MSRSYTVILWLMAGLMLLIAGLDPTIYGFLADRVPPEYRGSLLGVMRSDQIASLAVAGLSLWAAVLRVRGHRLARTATAVASFAYLVVPPMVGLLPFGYWYLRVRRREQSP